MVTDENLSLFECMALVLGTKGMKQCEASLRDKGHEEPPKFTKNLSVLCVFFAFFVLKI